MSVVVKFSTAPCICYLIGLQFFKRLAGSCLVRGWSILSFGKLAEGPSHMTAFLLCSKPWWMNQPQNNSLSFSGALGNCLFTLPIAFPRAWGVVYVCDSLFLLVSNCLVFSFACTSWLSPCYAFSSCHLHLDLGCLINFPWSFFLFFPLLIFVFIGLIPFIISRKLCLKMAPVLAVVCGCLAI